MRTAAEWIKLKPGRGDHAIVVAADIRERDIEVLEEAAKRVCDQCESGDPHTMTFKCLAC